MVYVTTITIAATGVAQRISSTRIPAYWVTLQGDPSNSADFYHGPSTVTSSTGQAVASGGGAGSPQYPPVPSAPYPYDLQHIWVLGTQNDIVRVMYFK